MRGGGRAGGPTAVQSVDGTSSRREGWLRIIPLHDTGRVFTIPGQLCGVREERHRLCGHARIACAWYRRVKGTLCNWTVSHRNASFRASI